jgi:hypothetical protein
MKTTLSSTQVPSLLCCQPEDQTAGEACRHAMSMHVQLRFIQMGLQALKLARAAVTH